MIDTAATYLVVGAVGALTVRRAVLVTAALLPRRPPGGGQPRSVTVLIAARNEEPVIADLLASLEKLAYPPGLLSFVIVCDGCDDGSVPLLHRWAHGRGDTHLLELPLRMGKAAALDRGLALARGELIVVVDADLRPQPDFLTEIVRPFVDPHTAAAAAYLRPTNAGASTVARYAALTSWVHQLVTSAGNDRLGLSPPTFGAAAYRRSALEEIGGFPSVAVGVDVATSRALTRHGMRTRLVQTAVAENTVSARLSDYWLQHVRWARGTLGARAADSAQPRRSLLQRLELAAAGMGYADRVVFVCAAVGALVGGVPSWVPVAFLAAPVIETVAASARAGVLRELPQTLFSAAALFPVDVAASVVALAGHLARHPPSWQARRRAAERVGENR